VFFLKRKILFFILRYFPFIILGNYQPDLQAFILFPANRYGHNTMSSTQFFPIPPEMLALACETITQRVSRLPFLRSGVMVTGELVGITMECLNAESTRTLPLTTPREAPAAIAEGLDQCLEGRLKVPGKTTVPVIFDVLVSAGIAAPAQVIERQYPHPRKALRLLPSWTWHIASTLTPRAKLAGSGVDDTSALSWMSICPVCRTGILNRVVGKQLFGVPHTDFIIECTHCGAKFIPVGPAFRLVSIANIHDPLWKKHLDQTYPPETWAAIARGTSPGGNPLKRPRQKPAAGTAPVFPLGNLSLIKDGSLVVPIEGKILYFKPVPLTFYGSLRDGVFSRIQTTVSEVLEDPAFSHLRDLVNAKYSQYLPLNAGLFLGQLRERHDPFYREFLHPYGDEKFGSFRAAESNDMARSGVLLVVVNRGIYSALTCPDSFRETINGTFGRITPEHCFLNGDEVRCRINAVLSNNRNEAGLFVYASNSADEQDRISGFLNGKSIAKITKNCL
jgi:hypothetical protein